MRERAAMMGGSYDITSNPGKGTSIVVQVPFISKRINRDSVH
jgi:signal transduction histidine kinase